ncbi:MAG: Rrf2 family transcriptional regulator [Rhodospirillales bacterium]
MKLTTKGRYAVMAMADLAANAQGRAQGPALGRTQGRATALAEIAERQEISLSYLEQLFAKLRRHGLVKSVRGPGGGYVLARDESDIRVADVILAVDEPIKATRCRAESSEGCVSVGKGRCITHDLWEELGNQIYLYLSSVSLRDVVEHRVLGRSGVLFHETLAQAGAQARAQSGAQAEAGQTP